MATTMPAPDLSQMPPESYDELARSMEMDEVKIQALRSVGDKDAAQILTARIRELERQYKRGFIERGMILLEVEQRGLWKHVTDRETGDPYHSLGAWLVGEAPHSRSDCYAALKAVKQLSEIPKEELLEVPRCNVEVLRRVPKQDRTKRLTVGGKRMTVIEAAARLPEKKLREVVHREIPNAHIEPKEPMILRPEVSSRKQIDIGLDAAKWYFEVYSREEALEAIVAAFLAEVCDKDGYAGMQMRAAYQKALDEGDAA